MTIETLSLCQVLNLLAEGFFQYHIYSWILSRHIPTSKQCVTLSSHSVKREIKTTFGHRKEKGRESLPALFCSAPLGARACLQRIHHLSLANCKRYEERSVRFVPIDLALSERIDYL